MKELAAISDNEFDGADADTVIENLDNELAEILKCADVSVKAAQDHVNERLLNGEDESEHQRFCRVNFLLLQTK